MALYDIAGARQAGFRDMLSNFMDFALGMKRLSAERQFQEWRRQQQEAELELAKRKLKLEEIPLRKELDQHLLDLKQRYKGNREKALADLKEAMPLLKDMYGDLYEDFDKEVMNRFNSLFTTKREAGARKPVSKIPSVLPSTPKPQTAAQGIGQTVARAPIHILEFLSTLPARGGASLYNLGQGIKSGITGQAPRTITPTQAYEAWSEMMDIPFAINWYKQKLQNWLRSSPARR